MVSEQCGVLALDQGRLDDPYISRPFSQNGVGLAPVHIVLGTGGRGTRDCRDRVGRADTQAASIFPVLRLLSLAQNIPSSKQSR